MRFATLSGGASRTPPDIFLCGDPHGTVPVGLMSLRWSGRLAVHRASNIFRTRFNRDARTDEAR